MMTTLAALFGALPLAIANLIFYALAIAFIQKSA